MILLSIILVSMCIGSFLNVLIIRYPKQILAQWRHEAHTFLEQTPPVSPSTMPSLWRPRSHCMHCKSTLGVLELIPIVSFLLQKGRCKHCKKCISWRYPIIELIAVFIALGIYTQFGLTPLGLITVIYAYTLLVLSVIDLEHQLLPDPLVLSMLWLSLLWHAYMQPTQLSEFIFASALGYLLLYCVAKIYLWVRKQEGMGHGDFKMLAMIGAFSGLMAVPITLLMACLVSIMVNGTLIFLKKMDYQQACPFGPYLAIGALIMLFAKAPILHLLTILWSP